MTGELNEVITLQRATITRNDLGEGVETWATLATRKARRDDVSDGEAIRAASVGAQLQTRFRIRYSSEVASLNARDRLQFDGQTYNITGVKVHKRARWLEISAVCRDDLVAAPTGSP